MFDLHAAPAINEYSKNTKDNIADSKNTKDNIADSNFQFYLWILTKIRFDLSQLAKFPKFFESINSSSLSLCELISLVAKQITSQFVPILFVLWSHFFT